MDSQIEQNLIATQFDTFDEAVQEEEQVRAWAAEQAMLADEEYMRKHRVEKP